MECVLHWVPGVCLFTCLCHCIVIGVENKLSSLRLRFLPIPSPSRLPFFYCRQVQKIVLTPTIKATISQRRELGEFLVFELLKALFRFSGRSHP